MLKIVLIDKISFVFNFGEKKKIQSVINRDANNTQLRIDFLQRKEQKPMVKSKKKHF